MSDIFHIITPSARPDNLPLLLDSISTQCADLGENGYRVQWWIVLDLEPTETFPDGVNAILDTAHPAWLSINVRYHHEPTPGAWGHPQRSVALDSITDDGWVWTLDDDNLIHPAMAGLVLNAGGDADALVWSQQRADGRVLIASPEALRPEGVDTAQYCIRRSIIGDERVRAIPADDGGFVQRVYAAHPDVFAFFSDIGCYHNGVYL